MVEGHQTQHDPYRGRYFKPQTLAAALCCYKRLVHLAI
jgi:hypothetical protein